MELGEPVTMTRRNLVIATLSFVLVICCPAQSPSWLVSPVLIKIVQAEYTKEALEAKISGAVYLTVLIDENGIPRYPHLVSGLGWGLDRKALQAVRLWRFQPALDHGVPVRMRVPIEVTFRLKRPAVVHPQLHEHRATDWR